MTEPRIRDQVILASAGSGKTYALSSRYLQLVDRGADPGAILASTFTRLAAGEILDRILKRAADAVLDPKEREQLAKAIGHPGLDRAGAERLLEALVRNLHRLQIRTLDSFFTGIVQAFALELGLEMEPDFTDEPTAARLRRAAIARVLDVADDEMLETLRVLTIGASRRVSDAIDDTVRGLYALVRSSPRKAWEWVPAPARPPLGADELRRAVDGLEEVADEVASLRKGTAARHARAIEIARRTEPGDVAPWKAFVDTGLAKAILRADGPPTYYGKELPSPVVAAYLPLIEHARSVFWMHLRDLTRATREILDRFGGELEDLARIEGVLSFDDLAPLVGRAVDDATFADILFRLDGAVEHLLLDEFQDTSLTQWHALAPFAEEIVANADRSYLCVGDVKQSLYGWRGAEPDILASMTRLLPAADLEELPLDRSWRSCPAIIDAVNRVFMSLPAQGALIDRAPGAVAHWARDFAEHATNVTKEGEGYVELRVVPEDEGEGDSANRRLAAAADLVKELHDEDPSRSIGVLTRTNRNVGTMLFELGPTQRDVPATGRGGGVLVDAAAVNAVLDLLRVIDDPDDTVAAFDVARSPLGRALNLPEAWHEHAAAGDRARVAREQRRHLLEHGYAETLRGWVHAIGGSADAREHHRLRQLVEAAEAFDREPDLRTSTFIDQALARPIEDAAEGAVQVMNVHQSKGLEFDVVILPDLEWSIGEVMQSTSTWERPSIDEPISRVARWVNKDIRRTLADEDLDRLFQAHIDRNAREHLALLYVAMTRAKRGLFMLVDPVKEKGTLACRVSHVLRRGLVAMPKRNDDVLFAHGDRADLSRRDDDAPPAERAEPDVLKPIDLRPAAGDLRPGAGAIASHRAETIEEVLRRGDDEASDRGTAMHALFEQVEWLGDFERSDEDLADVVRRARPRRAAPWIDGVVEEFRRVLGQPAVSAVLSRPAAARVEVLREHPFAWRDEATGTVGNGIIDRLVVEFDDAGRPRRATVHDYKTDAVTDATVADAVDRHRAQIEVYRRAAARRTGLDLADVAGFLVFTGPGLVREVEGEAG